MEFILTNNKNLVKIENCRTLITHFAEAESSESTENQSEKLIQSSPMKTRKGQHKILLETVNNIRNSPDSSLVEQGQLNPNEENSINIEYV